MSTRSRFLIDVDGAVCQLHHGPIQDHGDLLDGCHPIDLLAPELDVEALVAALALGRQDVVAGEGKLEEISVEGLKMVVPPCAAELVIMQRPHLWCVWKMNIVLVRCHTVI